MHRAQRMEVRALDKTPTAVLHNQRKGDDSLDRNFLSDKNAGALLLGRQCTSQGPSDADADSVGRWRRAWNELVDLEGTADSSLRTALPTLPSSATCGLVHVSQEHNVTSLSCERIQMPRYEVVATPASATSLPTALGEDGRSTYNQPRSEDTCPRYQLFYLRTNKFLEQHYLSSTLVLDAHKPHHILLDYAVPWITWKLPKAPQASGTSAPGSFEDRISSRRDREAFRKAMDMLSVCPTGFVTLVIRNIPPPHLHRVAPFLFLVIYFQESTLGYRNIFVDASVTSNSRMHPTLHVEWWAEMKLVREPAAPEGNTSTTFGKSYVSDTDTEDDEDDDVGYCYRHRHSLELASTSKFLAQDLLRRVATAGPQISTVTASTGLTCHSPGSPARSTTKERSPVQGRDNMTALWGMLTNDIKSIKRGVSRIVCRKPISSFHTL